MPQLGVGGSTPSPMKLRNASVEIYPGMAKVTTAVATTATTRQRCSDSRADFVPEQTAVH